MSIVAQDFLFDNSEPLFSNYVKVTGGHEIFVAEYGSRHGLPVLVVHGGPGAGCGAHDHRFFDPARFRIIILDQRGAGRSRPLAHMKENTTQDLIDDMEAVRKLFNIDKWLLFGGSWGSALSMAYGQQHASKVLGFILRGVCLARPEEFRHLIFGMSRVYRDYFCEMLEALNLTDQDDIIKHCYERLMSDDPNVHGPVARAFCKYDFSAAVLRKENIAHDKLKNPEFLLSLARGFFHYGVNDFFLARAPILENIDKIRHLPCHIVQGRYDMICPMDMAYDVHAAWPTSTLLIVEDAGHSSYDPPLTKALVEVVNKIAANPK